MRYPDFSGDPREKAEMLALAELCDIERTQDNMIEVRLDTTGKMVHDHYLNLEGTEAVETLKRISPKTERLNAIKDIVLRNSDNEGNISEEGIAALKRVSQKDVVDEELYHVKAREEYVESFGRPAENEEEIGNYGYLSSVKLSPSFEFLLDYKDTPEKYLEEIEREHVENYYVTMLIDSNSNILVAESGDKPKVVLQIRGARRKVLEWCEAKIGGRIIKLEPSSISQPSREEEE